MQVIQMSFVSGQSITRHCPGVAERTPARAQQRRGNTAPAAHQAKRIKWAPSPWRCSYCRDTSVAIVQVRECLVFAPCPLCQVAGHA